MRLKLTIAYDGTPFAGWQSQLHRRSVQDHLEQALQALSGHRIVVHGAGRTDAGVHALAQSAHIDIEEPQGKMKDPERWLTALNASLPPTLRVLQIQRVPATFHARFSAQHKTYRYLISNRKVLPPLLHERAWHLHGSLDMALLEELATRITGTHDFRGFTAKSGATRANTHRTLYHVKVKKQGNQISITFNGNGFLYHMVRMLVGAMVRVAQGKMTREDFLQRLQLAKPPGAPHTAPGHGLYLVKIGYTRLKSR